MKNPTIDAVETSEWLDSIEYLFEEAGSEGVAYILQQLMHYAVRKQITVEGAFNTPYLNTIGVEDEDKIPEYERYQKIAERINAIIRWNAIAMVVRAGKKAPELGGHLATYASAATLYDIGFDFFFNTASEKHGGDLVYFQGHASPGIYARAFLEGRVTEEQLKNFRQEVEKKGLSSYPHPWLMPDFWQFATVSMGLGPLQGIYQARFLKYLQHRGLVNTEGRKVWVYCGDGEMDEPESMGALSIAAREKLDNLIFVINCNLQRLDGPVRGNGKVIQEYERIFRGAGWHVIKVVWSGKWDDLLARDENGLLLQRMEECVDGEYQKMSAHDGAFIRDYFFSKYPELKSLVAHLSDDEIKRLDRGGHDAQKVYAAYAQAVKHTDQPIVILTKTVKGYGMGEAGEGRNITHQLKKLTLDQLKSIRDRFAIPIPDDKIEEIPFYYPGENSEEIKFIKQQREKLGGMFPVRRQQSESLTIPNLETFKPLLETTGDREISTTMAFVRILGILLKDKQINQRIVPIVPDESRTFGMEGLFRQIGIYSPIGQLYEPEDSGQLMYYHEDQKGQILEEGINEAGAFCSWIAAGISYSTNNFPMIPMYIYYSMFGFQRIGDLAWAAADMQARGFLLGATAGRTTLAGEGLQHQDGHSLLMAATIPNCKAYDPTFAYELAVIMQDGMERMYAKQENVFYYITLMNENYTHPAMPEGVREGIVKGLYLLQASQFKSKLQVQLLGSGTILRGVITAAKILEEKYEVACDIWSAPSFNELRREALEVERKNYLNPDRTPQRSYVEQCLADRPGPVIAATDYMRLYADQIRPFVHQRYVVLGTDGFGRSDTREQLRHFFEVDSKYIVLATLKALQDEKLVDAKTVKAAIKELGINPAKPNPVTV